jgi:hypothetical protein
LNGAEQRLSQKMWVICGGLAASRHGMAEHITTAVETSSRFLFFPLFIVTFFSLSPRHEHYIWIFSFFSPRRPLY